MDAKTLRERFWANDAQNGSPVGIPYKEIKNFQNLSFEEAQEFRKRKLESLLSFVQTNSKYYSRFSSTILEDYPIMNKALLTEHYDEISIEIDSIPGQLGPLYIQSTSGSTGTPFKIPQDYRKRQRRIAELKYFGEIVGFESHEMLVQLRTWNRWQSKTAKQIKEENIIPFDISKMADENLKNLCEIINDNQAICLRGYASSFDILERYVRDHAIELPSVKIIIAGSEALQDNVRQNVKDTIKCEIISQYANEECGILAQERIPTKATDNPMYFNNAGYIFECLKMEDDKPAEYGEVGRLVVTDLNNYAFPLIRYDTGDAAMLLPPDEFSNGFPVLGKLYGRRLDICYTTTNKPFHPMTIGRILKHYEGIIQWQFIQKGKKEYLLKCILKDPYNEDYLYPAIDYLKDSIGRDAIINIERVDGIPTLASGKRKAVVNEWKK